MTKVPTTTVMKLWNGLCNSTGHAADPGVRVIQRITKTPASTAVTAAGFPARREMSPSKNSPSIPPAKIPESVHQASSAALTPIMASATPVPSAPQTSDAPCSTRIDSRSPASGRKNL